MLATIIRTIFRNDQTGFTVLACESESGCFSATCITPFPLDANQQIEISGQWTNDPKHGKQLKVDKLDIAEPSTKAGILAYLSSGIITNIGPVTAERIVEAFGDKTLEILDNEPGRLLEVKGIGKKSLEGIMASWKDKRSSAKQIAELCKLGLSPAYAARVYKKYEDMAIAQVKRNPYQLADDVSGIGFRKADEIASNLGFEAHNPFRIKSGILYCLKEAQSDGHCYLPRIELTQKATEVLSTKDTQINNETVKLAIDELIAEKRLTATIHTDNEQALYTPSIYAAERYIQSRLTEFSQLPTRSIDLDRQLTVQGHVLKKEQEKAVLTAMTRRISIITGAAGSGKTTCLRALIEKLEENKISYALASPTGKAAKRMTEATDRPAKTLHRLLKIDKTGKFQHNEEAPLDDEFIIIDESSMMDAHIFCAFLKATTAYHSLVFIGDPNQLPPVGIGNVFKDMIDSRRFPITHLSHIHRQEAGGSIVQIANDILRGHKPIIPNIGDAYFFICDNPEEIAGKIVDFVTNRIPKKFGYKPEDIQVISPMKRGELGTDALNKRIQQSLRSGEVVLGTFQVNDRVMQMTNNYQKEVFNGDIGEVIEINTAENWLSVQFDGRYEPTIYERGSLDELSLAYACTVHKFQGSESKVIIAPVHTQHYVMLRRDLLYTAVTRARELLVLIGTYKAIGIGTGKQNDHKRYTKLFKEVETTTGTHHNDN